MNKRLFSILLLPTILLASCNQSNEVTAEVAKERAASIQTRQQSSDFTLPRKSKTELKVESEAASLTGEKISANMSIITEIDLDNLYYHGGVYTNTALPDESGNNVNVTYDFDAYLYVADNKIYITSITDYNGQKDGFTDTFDIPENTTANQEFEDSIDEVESDYLSIISDAFDDLGISGFDFNVTDPIELNYGTEFLAIINALTQDGTIANNEFTYNNLGTVKLEELKYLSTGEGNLEVSFKGNSTSSSTIGEAVLSTTGSISFNVLFDNYLFKSLGIDLSATLASGDEGTTTTMGIDITQSEDVSNYKPDTSNLN